MKEEKESFFEDSSYAELLNRYEDMIKTDKVVYFDVEEFEGIIDYYLDNHEYNKAFTATEIGCQQHPDSLSILIKKGQVFLEKGYPIETLKILKNMENIDVFNYDILLLKGNAHCLLGEISKAEAEFDKALSLAFEDKIEIIYTITDILTECNQYKLALKYLEDELVNDTENLDLLYETAFCYEKTGNYTKSTELLNKYLDNDPFAENIWVSLGEVYDKLEDYKKAIEAYDFALAINERYFPAIFNKANDLINLDDYKPAIIVLKDLLKFDNKNLQALCLIGEIYEKLENYDIAVNYYKKIIEIDFSYSESCRNVYKTCKITRNGKRSNITAVRKALGTS